MVTGTEIAEPEDLIIIVRAILSITEDQKCKKACHYLHKSFCELDLTNETENESTITMITQLLENSLISQNKLPCGEFYFKTIETFEILSYIDLSLLLLLLRNKTKREISLQIILRLISTNKFPFSMVQNIFSNPPIIFCKTPRNTLLLFLQWLIHLQEEFSEQIMQENISKWGKKFAFLLFHSISDFRVNTLQTLLSGAASQPSLLGSKVSSVCCKKFEFFYIKLIFLF